MICMAALAHSVNRLGIGHDLTNHLRSVAELARGFAAEFGGEDMAYYAGLWHDLGKFHPDFQKYLAACSANPGVHQRGPDHKVAGAIHALNTGIDMVAWVALGHHGGIPSETELREKLQQAQGSSAVSQTLSVATSEFLDMALQDDTDHMLPAFLCDTGSSLAAAELRLRTEFFLRMLFSTLVDADFLDTERHFYLERSEVRRGTPSLEDLWRRLEASQTSLSGKSDDNLGRVRHNVYLRCLEASNLEPGFFRLTVPTGGGKTRSGMAFALRHALKHGLRRVIVAVPYTSITEQTAQVYRDIFGEEVVLEHHSEAAWRTDDESEPSSLHTWARLASENWEAPIIVTTTVQLLESLFSNKPSRCRKLHNITGSVVILDEVQTLPTELLRPILHVLSELVSHYRVSVVLCSATLPAFQEEVGSFALKDVREIVPNPESLFQALRRVDYELPAGGAQWTWARVAEEMRRAERCMAVVNTKGDALALLDALGKDADALHLSTLLCGAHRRDVLREVKDRLNKGAPCRLVTTQVVEAGVDLDFPMVLRAMGPLDRIVQAAGRCNREHKLPGMGRVVVFEPEGGKLPRGVYETATAITRGMLDRGKADLFDPSLYREYFRSLFTARDLDIKRVQRAREMFDFPEVAERFRLIADDTVPVIVRYPPDENIVEALLERLRRRGEDIRKTMQMLQPYIVDVRRWGLEQMKHLVTEPRPELYIWEGKYDSVRGMVDLEAEDYVV